MEFRITSFIGGHCLFSHFWAHLMITIFLIVSFSIPASGVDDIGRNVCSKSKYVARPVPVKQAFKRPVKELDLDRCIEEGESPCRRVRTTYQSVTRLVVKMKLFKQNVTSCCAGWRKKSPSDKDCMQTECSIACQNGGRCVGRERCLCRDGYVGRHCQLDVDECLGRHSCQQKCINLPGSYECGCNNGFNISDDGTTCELCLSCTPEFQELESRLTSLPLQNSREDEEKMQSMQADVMLEMKRQSEMFDKLQSQYDTIVDVQKQLHILPQFSDRLDNLTGVQVQVNELRALEPQIVSLEDRVDEGLADLKASHADMGRDIELAIENWQASSVASSEAQAKFNDGLQEQLDRMTLRMDNLEKERDSLKANLTSALDQYEAAMKAMTQNSGTQQIAPTTPMDPYAVDHNGGEHMSLDRLSSLSQQISILEERMAECMCGGDYFG